MEPIRLLLLSNQVLFRDSLARHLSAEADCVLVSVCGSPAESLETLRRTPVDLVLMDSNLAGREEFEFMSAARQAGYQGRILVIASRVQADGLLKGLQFGVSGVFLDCHSVDTLLTAVRLVAKGDAWMDQSVMKLLSDAVLPRADGAQTRIHGREQDVLQGVLDGLSNKAIASRLGISESTVKAALRQLFRKAGVRTRSQLVRTSLSG